LQEIPTRAKSTGEGRKEAAMFGTVVFYRREKGYGFVRQAEQLSDLFFHASEFEGNENLLRVGAKVEFTFGEHKGKRVARNVRLLEEAQEEVRAILGSSAAA